MNLTDNYRLTTCKQVKKIPTGLDAWVLRMVGRFKGRRGVLIRLLKDAVKIDKESLGFSKFSDALLKSRMGTVREQLMRRFEKETLLTAFALVQESVKRTLGYRPYIEQLAGTWRIRG